MPKKYINIFQPKVPKIYPNWDFCFENKASGSPAGKEDAENALIVAVFGFISKTFLEIGKQTKFVQQLL
jgi:hypothetical protein